MVFDVARVRGLYTSLGDGWTYLNAHQIPQVPERVVSGVAAAFRTHAQMPFDDYLRSSHSSASQPNAYAHLDAARQAVAELTSSSAECVVLGPNRQFLVSLLAEKLNRFVRRQAGVVLSRSDAQWLTQPFTRLDATLRWAEPDLGTGQLPAWQFNQLVDGSTRLVVLSAAHPLLGTVAPVVDIVETVRAKSRAWVVVDASAYAAYRPIDVEEWQADIVLLDLATLGGPQISAMVFRDTSMFPRLSGTLPLELGIEALPNGLLGGVPNLVHHMSVLDEETDGVQGSMAALADYHNSVTEHLIDSLQGLAAVHIIGVSGDAAGKSAIALDRVPRLSFAVRDVPAEMVHRRLMDNHLVTTVSPADPLLTAMGAAEAGGSISLGLGPFSTTYEIDQLTRVLASLA